MINLKIDPEFQSQIPPLTDDEFKQLEENILKEGKLLSPLIVWNNTLVDGHSRYVILQKHPEIYFSTIPMKSLTVWRGHSTRPSLPAGTARKARGSLPRGRRNRLISPAKKNRAFPTGNALLYISLSYVDFGRVRPIQGRTLFLFCL